MKGVMFYLRGVGLKNMKPALYAWFFNLFLSLFIYYGYYRVFSDAAGESKLAADTAGTIGLFTFLADISRRSSGSLCLLFSLALLAALLFFLVSIFSGGGIYSVMVGDERPTFSNLIASSVENFFNMFKIFLVNILNWVVALAVPGLLLLLFVNIKPLILSETAQRIFSYLWIGVIALIYVFSTAVYDFSRIIKLREEKNVFFTFKTAIIFSFSNKVTLLAIFFMYGISLGILLLIYVVFSHFVEDVLYIFLLFLIYQGFVIARYFFKVAVIRAEIRLTHIGE
jgi:hypothetical protein